DVYYSYTAQGQLKKQYGSQINPVEFLYDSQGRQRHMLTWQDFNHTTGEGIAGPAITEWKYDPRRGWLSKKQDHSGLGASYTYTRAGRLATRIWARGVETTYKYHPDGSLSTIDYDDTTP